MRRLLLALLLVVVAALPAHAAIAYVQKTECSAGGTTVCTTPAITSTTGNLFIASSSYCCAAFTSVTDSKTNSYSNAVPEVSATGSGFARVRQDYIASGTGGGSHTFTLTGASSAFYGSVSVIEVSGAAASPLDRTATGADAGQTSHTTAATATTTQANELLCGVGGMDVSTSYTTDTGAGWTERTNISTTSSIEGILTGTKIVSATGAYTYTFTTSSSSLGSAHAISTWKEAAAAAGVRQRCVGCGADGKVIE